MSRTANVLAVMILAAVLGSVPELASAAQLPVAVSPGSFAGVVISDPCPTFSWGAYPGAQGYELAVYRLDVQDGEARPVFVLQQTIAGSALSWTPSLDLCLERGRQYGWSVRAHGPESTSDWSRTYFFDLTAAPTEAEFRQALEIVRSYLETRGESALAERLKVEAGDVEPMPRPRATQPPRPARRVPANMLFSISGGAYVQGDLELGGSLLSSGDICIGFCP